MLTHPDIIVFAFCRQGKYDKAEPLYKESLAIKKKVFGNEHPKVALALNNLAWLLKEQGNAEEAARLGKQALVIFEKVLGPDHPNTQTVRSAWG